MPIIYGGLLTVERLATDDAIALSFTILKSEIKKKEVNKEIAKLALLFYTQKQIHGRELILRL